MLDLFRAGAESTAVTLTWAMKQLVIHADIQQQLREEVDEVIYVVNVAWAEAVFVK